MLIILAHARKDITIVEEVKKCFEKDNHIFTMGELDNRFTVKCMTVDDSKIFVTFEIVGGINKVVETCNIKSILSDFYMYQIELAYKLNNPDELNKEYILLNHIS